LARQLRGIKGLAVQCLYDCRMFYQDLPGVIPTLLLTRLGFSHFLELLALNRPLRRAFCEVQAVKNSWSVGNRSGLNEQTNYSESDLETAIIAHL
jgi:hypothetical protein